jgi:hypothetical protein
VWGGWAVELQGWHFRLVPPVHFANALFAFAWQLAGTVFGTHHTVATLGQLVFSSTAQPGHTANSKGTATRPAVRYVKWLRRRSGGWC